MPLCSIEEAIADIRQGKMIILVDDEGRENEGDLTMAAEHVTPEAINFMAKFGRGLICLPMAPEIIDKLQLPLNPPPLPLIKLPVSLGAAALYGDNSEAEPAHE